MAEKRKFNAEALQQLAWEEPADGLYLVNMVHEAHNMDRNMSEDYIIFEDESDGSLWRVDYEWHYDWPPFQEEIDCGDEVTAYRVHPVERTVVAYEYGE